MKINKMKVVDQSIYTDLELFEIGLIETLKNLDYKFTKKGQRDVKKKSVEVVLPKELDERLEQAITMIREQFQGMEGQNINKSRLIVAMLMYLLDAQADGDGNISPNHYDNGTTDRLFNSIVRNDNIGRMAEIRKMKYSEDEMKALLDPYKKERRNRTQTLKR